MIIVDWLGIGKADKDRLSNVAELPGPHPP